jgi:D-3-phosphoglycerate dehydrogenase
LRVLIADKFEQSGLDGLKAAGCDVLYEADLKDDTLTTAIRESGADVLVVRSTNVTAPMLAAGALSLIVRAGAGYNTIDVATASKRGIYVSNCPGKNAIAVAELAFALILALDRRLPDNVRDLRAGTWNKKEYSKARGLYGRTIGLLGYGNIGQEVAKRAHGFGMPVVVWSRRFASGAADASADGVPWQIARTPQEVAERADVLSIHLALNADTKNLVSASILERLRPGSYVINTARAEVMDYAALEEVARAKNLRVGLDVFEGEPAVASGAFSPAIRSVPLVYGTHHIGASTDQAQEAIRGGNRPNRSPPTRTPARFRTSSTWRKRPPRRTCWWCGTTIGQGFWRTCSTDCEPRTSTCKKPKT